MRILLAALLALLPLTANAALVWGESSQHGYPLTHWVRGSSVTEATNLLRAHAGKNAQTILSCRQPGWFAYVGSDRDFRRGVSCGYETRAAALYKARVECEHEGGSCEIERLGYDTGEAVANVPETSIPQDMPGATNDRSPINPNNGPVTLQ